MDYVKQILEEQLNRLNSAYDRLVINGSVSKESDVAIDNRSKVKQIEIALSILCDSQDKNMMIKDLDEFFKWLDKEGWIDGVSNCSADDPSKFYNPNDLYNMFIKQKNGN